jgi:DNA-binding NarL/FixJ family response regulator
MGAPRHRRWPSMNGARDLTRREREIIACVARGMTNVEIARELGVSTGTVKSHLSSVFAKLGVSNRTQAAMTTLEGAFDAPDVAHG